MALEEIFVTGATGFMKKLVSVAAIKIGKAGAIDKDLEKLKDKLEMISAVTSDAEKKQVKDKAVLLWLRRLQDVAYDIDDLLDEISYETIRVKAEKVTAQSKINFSLEIAERIKTINQELDEIAKLKDMYQLEYIEDDQNTEPLDRMTASFVDDSKIVGRKHDKSRIVEMLLITNPSSDNFSPQEKISVVSIVGMGESGRRPSLNWYTKTTRLREALSQERGKILESFTGEACDISDVLLVRKVREKISGKKFLLVLDDLWNENAEDWEKLKGYLSWGGQGSRILVTTRSENVASIVRGTIPPHNLTTLSQQDCWLIIKNRAFSPGGEVETLTMSNIGEEISRKCAGLPLAANFLGNLMRLKRNESDWLAIRDDEVFNTPENPNKIILILKLSYDHLPSHLKKCFSYCCLFPKDWEFNRETLIRLWIAEGFVHPPSTGGNRYSLEYIGNEYFLSLLSSSFFQDVERNYDSGDIETFKMHDLVHDLALSVVGTHEVRTLNASEMNDDDVSQTRRLRLITKEIPKNANKLRTVFLQERGFVFPPSNKHLRVIYRLGQRVKRETISLPCYPFKFKHMRYLDLSYSNLRDVHAESIHQLYNLQTLDLSHSKNVQKILKQGIGSLVNLRHLDLHYSDAKILPESITRLVNLSSLDISYADISELPDSISTLYNLSMFYFSDCRQIKALPRNFGGLTQLRSLDLSGTEITELPESLTSNICKLEVVNFGVKCKLPEDIKNWVELRSLYYWGNTDHHLIMPRGIENLTRLEVLRPFLVRKEEDVSIDNSGTSSIHELANLNSLRELIIKNLENVRGGKIEAESAKLKDKLNIQHLELGWKFEEEEEEEVDVNNSVLVLEGLQPHPNLEEFFIEGFPGLKLPKWMRSSSCLPNLVELILGDCKSCTKLVGLGQLPCLQILTIKGMNSVRCLGEEFYYQQEEEEEEEDESKDSATSTTTRTLFPSLTELWIFEMENLQEWFAPDNSFPCLGKVVINRCGNLTSIPDLRLWTCSLRRLTMMDCKKLEKEPITYYLDKFLPSVEYKWN